VPITTEVVSSNPAHGDVYSIQRRLRISLLDLLFLKKKQVFTNKDVLPLHACHMILIHSYIILLYYFNIKFMWGTRVLRKKTTQLPQVTYIVYLFFVYLELTHYTTRLHRYDFPLHTLIELIADKSD
jgi:hypothetical protein